MLALAAVLTTMHLEGDVTTAGGDYVDVAFSVPAGTREIHIVHADGSSDVILDWGVWSPDGFRGWSGGNLEDIVIGEDESSRSYLPGAITPGTWTLVIGKAKLAAGAGHYVVDVVCRDDATLAVRTRAPFTASVLARGRRWYKGDLHVHSSESGDADADIATIGALAAQRGLDFVELSDHNTDSQLALAAAAQPLLPSVLLVRGAEVTTYAGHANAIGLDRYVDHRIGVAGRTIRDVAGEVASRGALLSLNHPTLDLDGCIGCAWTHSDTPWEAVAGLEIATGKWDLVERLFVPAALALWDEQLGAGHRLAALGGSDDHSAGAGTGIADAPLGSPTTLVLADELSEPAIIDAIRRGRTMVMLRGPDDPFVDPHIARADGSLADIGDDVDGVAAVELTARITGGTGYQIDVIRDGESLGASAITSDDFAFAFTDEPAAGPHRYRVEILTADDRRVVVTSHFYVTSVGLGGGCGCRGSHPDTALVVTIFAVMMLVRRRRTLASL